MTNQTIIIKVVHLLNLNRMLCERRTNQLIHWSFYCLFRVALKILRVAIFIYLEKSGHLHVEFLEKRCIIPPFIFFKNSSETSQKINSSAPPNSEPRAAAKFSPAQQLAYVVEEGSSKFERG